MPLSTPTPYLALALQTACFAVNQDAEPPAARNRMAASITRIGAQVAASKRFIGQDLRLVVLPEYFLTGFPMGEGAAVWAEKAALEIDGPEYCALGAIAKQCEVWLAGNA